MNMLVTGCGGFIGSNLCELLLSLGHEVVGVDSLTTYYDPELKLRNVSQCLDSDRFRFLECDICELQADIIGEAEVIFHLAAQPGVRGSWGDTFETYVAQNILATQILLERSRKSPNLKRFVFSSSSSVYGNTRVEKVTEDHPKQPHSPYGVTKLAAENLCSLYASNYHLPAVSLRLFTVCGPRQRPDMMFHSLIRAALTNSEFILFGDGSMKREFTSVFDVVDALQLAAENSARQGIFNVGGGEVISVNEAISLVEELTCSRIRIKYGTEIRGDVRSTGADTSLVEANLNYRPKRTIRDSLLAQIQTVEELLTA